MLLSLRFCSFLAWMDDMQYSFKFWKLKSSWNEKAKLIFVDYVKRYLFRRLERYRFQLCFLRGPNFVHLILKDVLSRSISTRHEQSVRSESFSLLLYTYIFILIKCFEHIYLPGSRLDSGYVRQFVTASSVAYCFTFEILSRKSYAS